MEKHFSQIASKTADIIGSAKTFSIAVIIIVLWLLSGPLLHFSDTWQLIINTSTTIITFLTVFLIQHTQNKNDRATQLKLDELIHALRRARDEFIDLEDQDDDTLKRLRSEYGPQHNPSPQKKRKK